MRVVIIEDEISACENFIYLLSQIKTSIEVVQILDGVKSSVEYFQNKNEIDLIFMDVHLGDGIAFEIFEEVEIATPIIFTTAYDQYAIKAFKVNSIDYLLKPINQQELENAIVKFEQNNTQIETNLTQIHQILTEIQQAKKYKKTFLVHKKESLIPIETNVFAYFYIDLGLVKGITHNNESFILDKKMEDLEMELDPTLFYRVNRQYITQRKAVQKVNYSFNGKLTVIISPKPNESVVISKAKSKHFKEWLGS